MKKYLVVFATCAVCSLGAQADEISEVAEASEVQNETVEAVAATEVGTDAPEPAGFLTGMLNNAIEKALPQNDPIDEKVVYGRSTVKWASAPKFGGYAIGKYAYSGKDDGKNNGSNSFSARLIRAYVDGTILKDFKYRLQVEMQNDAPGPHVKDFFVSWSHWKELEIKIGQFKRAFSFENPYNPWDVGVGDYSQLVKKLAGFSDYIGTEASNTGGRDQGIQVQGDVLPVGKDKHRLFHYQLGVYNGQGINHADANKQKDVIGTFQVQPIKDLYVGFFGWTGNATYKKDKVSKTVRRERYAFGLKYEHKDWTVRGEYAHSTGHSLKVLKDETEYSISGPGSADAWYATVGVPCTKWLKVYAKYDVFRDGGQWGKSTSIYSICPNFQLHKNLMFQLQYNFVNDRTLAAGKHNYNELWVETYFRF